MTYIRKKKYTNFEKAVMAVNMPELNMNHFWEACPFTMEELKSKSRKQNIVAWRYVAMFFIYKEKNNLTTVSNMFDLTHASILNGFKRIQNIKTDYLISEVFEAVKRGLKQDVIIK